MIRWTIALRIFEGGRPRLLLYPDRPWPSPRWFDFLKEVVRAEPVVIRGALGFGLKAVANAMYEFGLIETHWDAGPADGLGAMMGAWWCAREAERLGVGMSELDR